MKLSSQYNYKIKGLILDLEGTLIHDQHPISKAVEVVDMLREKGFQLRFITNMTGSTPDELSAKLMRLGFNIFPDEIETSVSIAIKYLRKKLSKKGVFLALPEVLRPQFSEFKQNNIDPDFVILGDLGDEISYLLLNQIFYFLRRGAKLLAFHKNPYFFRNEQIFLDTGFYLAGFETILQSEPIITGKPSKEIFQNAIQSMGLEAQNVAVIGDDLQTDIMGAKNLNIFAIQVKTGKFQEKERGKADLEIECIDQLMEYL